MTDFEILTDKGEWFEETAEDAMSAAQSFMGKEASLGLTDFTVFSPGLDAEETTFEFVGNAWVNADALSATYWH